MGLNLKELSQGREKLHTRQVESLGDTITIRELSRHDLEEFRKVDAYFKDDDMTQDGIVKLLCMTLVDGETELTEEMVEAILVQNAKSVIQEIVKHVMDIHTGEGSGESSPVPA